MSTAVGDDEIVVGEAVALDVARAGFGRRLLGGVLDVIIQVLLVIGLILVSLRALDALPSEALLRVVLLVIVVGGLVGWPVAWEVTTRGRSPGKFATGERVVRLDGGSIVYRQSLIRALIGFVEFWTFGFTLAAFAVLMSKRSQRLGDMVAGTMVVRERVPLRLPPPAPMPPYLARWAAGADISTLDPTLALNVRQYLQRRGQLSPQARQRVAQRLSGQVAGYVAPQPPPCPPDDFMMAVLAERARRDRRRLAAARTLSDRLLGQREPVSLAAVGSVPTQSPVNPAYGYGTQPAGGGAAPRPPQP